METGNFVRYSVADDIPISNRFPGLGIAQISRARYRGGGLMWDEDGPVPLCSVCRDPDSKIGIWGSDSEGTWICERCWHHPPLHEIDKMMARRKSSCVHPDCELELGEERCPKHHLPSVLVFLGLQR